MRIVIDLQGAQTESRFRGIGRYSLSLAKAIAANTTNHDIWLTLNTAFPSGIDALRAEFAGLIPPERIRLFAVPTPIAENALGNAWRTHTAELIREHFLQQLQPDIVLITSLFEGYLDDASTAVGAIASPFRTVVVLYDLIPWLNPDTYLSTVSSRQYYERKLQSLQKADMLLAISAHSRQEAISTLSLSPERVINISTAANACFKPCPEPESVLTTLRQRLGITRDIILYAPGGFDPRKNLDGLIAAYGLLPPTLRRQHQLVIASKSSEGLDRQLRQYSKQAGLANSELILAGHVEESELVALYTAATLFVFPSKHEGFGLPALEAMTCGAAVIGANSTSIPEVIGWDAALFDPHSPQSIMEKMAQALTDAEFRQQLRRHGQHQALQFSWDKTAQRALQALETLAPAAPRRQCQAVTETALIQAIAAIPPALGTPSERDLLQTAETIAFNLGNPTGQQLLVDISDLVRRDAKSGIQRVIRSILLELLKAPPPGTTVRPIYFDGVGYCYANAFTHNLAIGTQDWGSQDMPVGYCQDDTYLDLDLNLHISPAVHSLHQQMRQRGVRLHFIVYDILPLQHPKWWPQGIAETFGAWLGNIATVADGLHCISAAVANDLRGWLQQHPSARLTQPSIHSFHLGADIENSLPSNGLPDNASQVLALLRSKPTFLMVGTVEPRKGHAQTLAAFELLWQQQADINLVVVGRHGWLVDTLAERLRRHAEGGQRLFWLEGISDEYLQQVYAVSTCLIAASEGEGFGLPLIEAAQHKLPIIARDLPVFQEVAGAYAHYFHGLQPQALATTIQQWLSLDVAGLAPQSRGMPWLTWQESTQQLIGNITL